MLLTSTTRRRVRASPGSLFAVPVVRVDSPKDVIGWAHDRAAVIVGTDESGTVDIDQHDITGPTLLVVGNEAARQRGFKVPDETAPDR